MLVVVVLYYYYYYYYFYYFYYFYDYVATSRALSSDAIVSRLIANPNRATCRMSHFARFARCVYGFFHPCTLFGRPSSNHLFFWLPPFETFKTVPNVPPANLARFARDLGTHDPAPTIHPTTCVPQS